MQMAYTNTIVFIILFLGIAGGMVALEFFWLVRKNRGRDSFRRPSPFYGH